MSRCWFEISLIEHWSRQPHGIARVAMSLFLESLNSSDIRYFYYSSSRETFVAPDTVEYFVSLAKGDVNTVLLKDVEANELADCLEESDRLIITGAGWGLKNYIADLENFKKSKLVEVASIFYDVIAVHSPHFFVREYAQMVAEFQNKLAEFSDHIFSISRSTEADVKRLFHKPDSCRTHSVIRLGFDFHQSDGSMAIPGNMQRHVETNYILCVGTIESRKNHFLLYLLMRKLVLTIGSRAPKILIVGKIGWLSETAVEFIQRDPLVRDHFEILTDIDDKGLEALYSNCIFTIYPSYYEGYGLPIIESYARGKICVSSNTSSMGEIAPFKDLTFDPYDFESAFQIISDLLSNHELIESYESQIDKVGVRTTWRDCFADLMDRYALIKQ